MSKDYIPQDWPGLKGWAENFQAQLTARAVALGLPNAKVLEINGKLATLVYAITAYLNAKQAADALLADLKGKYTAACPTRARW